MSLEMGAGGAGLEGGAMVEAVKQFASRRSERIGSVHPVFWLREKSEGSRRKLLMRCWNRCLLQLAIEHEYG